MTTTEKNKELVARFVTALNARDIESALAIFAPDFVNHAAIPQAQGTSGLRTILTKILKAMPDMTWTNEDLIADGDRVVARVRVRGTQTGALEMALVSLPASGREMSTEQIHVFRIADDRVVEHWAGRDDFGMLRQLGHAPVAAPVRTNAVEVAS